MNEVINHLNVLSLEEIEEKINNTPLDIWFRLIEEASDYENDMTVTSAQRLITVIFKIAELDNRRAGLDMFARINSISSLMSWGVELMGRHKELKDIVIFPESDLTLNDEATKFWADSLSLISYAFVKIMCPFAPTYEDMEYRTAPFFGVYQILLCEKYGNYIFLLDAKEKFLKL